MLAPTPPSRALAPGFTQREFRDALGSFATGVTVVTARAPDGALVGLTANSFNSVSLDPPLVLWSLARTSSTMAVFSGCTHYAVNVLSAAQVALAQQFAARGVDRFAGVGHTLGHHGVPLLSGALATFECFNRSQHVEGDHLIFVGEVEHCHRATPDTLGHAVGSAAPLLYHGGKFYTEHPL
jgi:flavin reductase (DIM6/NTAB) family NADH-FMN oxidoreductase RutF